jgi:hypothetical protein
MAVVVSNQDRIDGVTIRNVAAERPRCCARRQTVSRLVRPQTRPTNGSEFLGEPADADAEVKAVAGEDALRACEYELLGERRGLRRL